jgi:hypothetical protein
MSPSILSGRHSIHNSFHLLNNARWQKVFEKVTPAEK